MKCFLKEVRLMPEVMELVDVYRVDRIRDKCHEGRMRPTGVALTTFPEQIQHACTKCGFVEAYMFSYPRIVCSGKRNTE